MRMAVLPCQFTRKGQLYATVQIGNEVVEVLVVFSPKRGFQLRVRQRRGNRSAAGLLPSSSGAASKANL